MERVRGLTAVFGALAPLLGCSGDEHAPADATSSPTQAAASDAPETAAASATQPAPAQRARDGADDSPLGVAPAPRGTQRSPAMADKFARRSAAFDGWESEVWSERTGAQLKALGKLLGAPGAFEPAQLSALLAADFACTPLRPAQPAFRRRLGALEVAREDAPAAEATAEGALEALRALRRGFEPSDELRCQFKTIFVDVAEERVTTRCYVAIDAPARATRTIHATWRCEWSVRGSDDAAPKLARLWLEAFEESSAPAPLFEEATAAVFADAPSFEQQLALGLEHWAGRIPRELGMALIGHEGLALGDADGDGLDDLYLCQPGGLPNRLYLRQRDGTLRDASAAAGVDFLDASRAALLCDLDNDGDQDLAVELDPLLVVLENVGGARFVERARLEVSSTTSLSAADYDEDGDLDLYACGYVVPDEAHVTPLPYHDANNGRPNTLLRNEIGPDGWRLVDATLESGLDQNNRRFSFAASWEDYDDDGDLDLYVANDFGRNNLYRNEGGRFRDVAAEAGVEDMAAGMGVSWGDFDRDGRIDLYVSNMFSSAGERVSYQRRFLAGASQPTLEQFQRHARGNTLLRNRGDGTFEDASERAGVTMGRWAWGALFVELDNDGWLDLFVPNGFVTGEDPEDL